MTSHNLPEFARDPLDPDRRNDCVELHLSPQSDESDGKLMVARKMQECSGLRFPCVEPLANSHTLSLRLSAGFRPLRSENVASRAAGARRAIANRGENQWSSAGATPCGPPSGAAPLQADLKDFMDKVPKQISGAGLGHRPMGRSLIFQCLALRLLGFLMPHFRTQRKRGCARDRPCRDVDASAAPHKLRTYRTNRVSATFRLLARSAAISFTSRALASSGCALSKGRCKSFYRFRRSQ